MNEPLVRRKIDTLQVGRGIAALCVVLFHINITLKLDKYLGVNIFPVFDAGGPAGVMYFFVLSGFVIFLAHHNDFGKRQAVKRFLWKRFQRIYPPIWATLLCVIPLFLWVMKTDLDGYAVLSSALLLPIEKDNILSVLWTLRHEFLFYALFALALWKPSIGFVVAALWLIGAVIQPFVFNDYPLSFLFNSVHVLFAMGVAACWLYQRKLIKYPFALIITGAVIFICAWWMQAFGSDWREAAVQILFGVGAMAIMMGSAAWEEHAKVALPRPLIFLGEASYSIYLVHFPVVSGLCKISQRLRDVHIPLEVMFVGFAIIAVVTGIIFYMVVEKRLLALFKRQEIA